jgi:hypothetical protein
VTRVVQNAPLVVTTSMSLPAGELDPGDPLLLSITITNRSGTDQNDVVIAAEVPAGIASFNPAVSPGATCSVNCDPGERIVWTLPTLAAGDSHSFEVPVFLASGGSALPDGSLVVLRVDASSQTAESTGTAVRFIPEPSAALLGAAALLALRVAARSRRRWVDR